jgi:hypothetical protein
MPSADVSAERRAWKDYRLLPSSTKPGVDRALGRNREDVSFGQQPRMVASRTREEVGQFSDTLDARLRVAVAACELSDQDRYCRWSVPEWDDHGGR